MCSFSRWLLQNILLGGGASCSGVPEAFSLLWSWVDGLLRSRAWSLLGELLGHFVKRQAVHSPMGHHYWRVIALSTWQTLLQFPEYCSYFWFEHGKFSHVTSHYRCPNQDDRYEATMHPVTADDRIQFPSHFKHFDMKMFAFVQDNVVLKNQVG